jgi:hypothetical protein
MAKRSWQRAAIRLGARNGVDEVEADVEGVLPGETATAHASLRGGRRGRRTLWPFLGSTFVAAVAYVDPGNFATSISGGAQFGYPLLWVVLTFNLIVMLVQPVSAKLARFVAAYPVVGRGEVKIDAAPPPDVRATREAGT